MAQRSSALAGTAGTHLLHQMIIVFFQQLCLALDDWLFVSWAAIAAKSIAVSCGS